MKYQNAIKTLTDTADFYYSMYGAEIDENDTYWFEKWRTALELIERVQGLEENSLYLAHMEKCEFCEAQNI